MKETGIVRRIDACDIIGQNPGSRMNTGVSLILSESKRVVAEIFNVK